MFNSCLTDRQWNTLKFLTFLISVTESCKRKFEVIDSSGCCNHTECQAQMVNQPANLTESQAEKRQVREGFSWWTCLQLGLPLSESKPQAMLLKKGN